MRGGTTEYYVFPLFIVLFDGVNGFLIGKKNCLNLRENYISTEASHRSIYHGPNQRLSEIFNSESRSSSLNDKSGWNEEEFDFETAFQKRLDDEGGVTGVKVKSSTRFVADTANSVAEDVSKVSDSMKQTFFQTPGDPDIGNFTSTSIFLVLVMLLAGGTLFLFALGAPFPYQPFETTVEGKALMFGV
mmetsp:Transcript_10378/g.11854  ORF Transcript_10378/g.11854 Transcript_10378/m.11854 type:complete len:188 (+) Transcript_10378:176-739(+)